MPPTAATIGTAARRNVASSPASSSRLISRPTTKKKRAMSASLTQWSSDVSMANGPKAKLTGMCQKS